MLGPLSQATAATDSDEQQLEHTHSEVSRREYHAQALMGTEHACGSYSGPRVRGRDAGHWHQYMMLSTENVITVSSASHDCSFWLTSRSRDGRRAWTRTLSRNLAQRDTCQLKL
jgi:hypothetical protein